MYASLLPLSSLFSCMVGAYVGLCGPCATVRIRFSFEKLPNPNQTTQNCASYFFFLFWLSTHVYLPAQADVASWTGKNWCLVFLGSSLFPCCTSTWVRGVVRKKQGIPGELCSDCIAAACCYPCTTAQLYTEYKAGTYDERKHQEMMTKRMEDTLNSPQRIASPTIMMINNNNNSNNHNIVSSPHPSPVPQMAMGEPVAAVPMAYATKDDSHIMAHGPTAPKAAY